MALMYLAGKADALLVFGLSTDTKPPLPTNDWTFFEIDTGKMFRGVSTVWTEILNPAYPVLATGLVAATTLGSGTPTGLAFLRGDRTWQQPNLTNCSTTDQTINAATTALLTGSTIAVPAWKLAVGTRFTFRLSVSKTAAGTAANTFIFQLGTNGSTADADIVTFALPVGTAAVDTGQIDITITIRGPLSASCVAQGLLRLTHNLSATGLSTLPGVALKVTSGTFDATTANLIASLACTTAASTVLTFQQVIAEAVNL